MHKIVSTKDGSSTLIRTDLEEHYHSVHGAYNEAMHVFISSGLDLFSDTAKTINILEVGFGTGLNALLSLQWSIQARKKVHYVGVDNYPLATETVLALNYCDLETLGSYTSALQSMHDGPWEEAYNITPTFTLTKLNADFNSFTLNKSVDLVYFDAFSPGLQPELWTRALFQKLFNWMNVEGVLVTYSAKGSVRRDLISVGFSVEKIPGPPGKREMLRCFKKRN